MPRTVADMLVATLAGASVKRIYGIVGDSLNPITDAVRRDGRIQWVHVRHEETGAFAAEGATLTASTRSQPTCSCDPDDAALRI